MSEDEIELLDKYGLLNDTNKKKSIDYMDLLKLDQDKKEQHEE